MKTIHNIQLDLNNHKESLRILITKSRMTFSKRIMITINSDSINSLITIPYTFNRKKEVNNQVKR